MDRGGRAEVIAEKITCIRRDWSSASGSRVPGFRLNGVERSGYNDSPCNRLRASGNRNKDRAHSYLSSNVGFRVCEWC